MKEYDDMKKKNDQKYFGKHIKGIEVTKPIKLENDASFANSIPSSSQEVYQPKKGAFTNAVDQAQLKPQLLFNTQATPSPKRIKSKSSSEGISKAGSPRVARLILP